jgi:hypothetical protein
MSRRIAKVVDESERLVTKLVGELESKNGYPSHDVRHLAENIQKVRAKIADLGLDPDDTTAEELYHSLLVRFENNSRKFDEHMGVEGSDANTKYAKAAEILTKNLEVPVQWALKPKAAKQLLKTNPPKKVMKSLGYRSVESMLKRRNIFEAYLAAQVLESKTWHKGLEKQVSKLDQTDFEMRPVKLLALSCAEWAETETEYYTVFDNSIGAAAIWPSEELNKTPLLTMALLLMEELPGSRIKSGTALAAMGQDIAWWADMDHLIAELSSDHVSLNLKDVALNSHYENTYKDRILDHGRLSFWKELVGRYANRPEADGLFDSSVKEKVSNLRFNVPEPAYEFSEEFDG